MDGNQTFLRNPVCLYRTPELMRLSATLQCLVSSGALHKSEAAVAPASANCLCPDAGILNVDSGGDSCFNTLVVNHTVLRSCRRELVDKILMPPALNEIRR